MYEGCEIHDIHKKISEKKNKHVQFKEEGKILLKIFLLPVWKENLSFRIFLLFTLLSLWLTWYLLSEFMHHWKSC